MSASTQQRRAAIMTKVFESGHVMVRELAEEMRISESTVRRDLHTLSEADQVELIHGGAVLPRGNDFSFHSKSRRNVDAKRVIGELAGDLVADGDQVLVDSGTTCFEMAPFLRRKRGLLVIVSSTRMAMELNTPGLTVLLLGGQYRPDRMDSVGPMAMAALDQLRGYQAFIGVDGLSVDFGLTSVDIDSADLYRKAIANSREAVLLADHTKFDRPSLFKIVDVEAISRIVTDRPPPPEWMEFFSRHEIEAIFPQPELSEVQTGAGEVHTEAHRS